MRVKELHWNQSQIEHIAQHNVTPEEVEEVCSSNPFVQRTKTCGDSPVYHVLGQTPTGRYLFSVIIQFPDGKGYPVTARSMTDKEKRRYKQRKTR